MAKTKGFAIGFRIRINWFGPQLIHYFEPFDASIGSILEFICLTVYCYIKLKRSTCSFVRTHWLSWLRNNKQDLGNWNPIAKRDSLPSHLSFLSPLHARCWLFATQLLYNVQITSIFLRSVNRKSPLFSHTYNCNAALFSQLQEANLSVEVRSQTQDQDEKLLTYAEDKYFV